MDPVDPNVGVMILDCMYVDVQQFTLIEWACLVL